MNIWQCSATAILGACMMLSPLGAQAAPLGPQSALAMSGNAAEASPVVDVQYRRHHRHSRHYRHHRSRHWHHDHDNGGAVAAGAIIGLAAGAIAANAAAGGSAVAYCSQRYRSYDPASGTYLGYDGYRHPCP